MKIHTLIIAALCAFSVASCSAEAPKAEAPKAEAAKPEAPAAVGADAQRVESLIGANTDLHTLATALIAQRDAQAKFALDTEAQLKVVQQRVTALQQELAITKAKLAEKVKAAASPPAAEKVAQK